MTNNENCELSNQPENVALILRQLQIKEEALEAQALELESKLELSESQCCILFEENRNLKSAIGTLETEIAEVSLMGLALGWCEGISRMSLSMNLIKARRRLVYG